MPFVVEFGLNVSLEGGQDVGEAADMDNSLAVKDGVVKIVELDDSLVDGQNVKEGVELNGATSLLVDMNVKLEVQTERVEAMFWRIKDIDVTFRERVVVPNVT